MTRWVFVLALLLAFPAGAQDKGKKKDEKKPISAVPADLLKQAEEKSAAGDLDGAIDLLRKAQGAEATAGEASLRLGRALELSTWYSVGTEPLWKYGAVAQMPSSGGAW